MSLSFRPASPESRCTVVVHGDGASCAAPAVLTIVKSASFEDDVEYHECADHALPSDLAKLDAPEEVAPAAHPATRSVSPFLLVRGGEIVGYANSRSAAVVDRARKAGAAIVPNANVR